MPMFLKKSKRTNKKYVVKDEKRTIHFGDDRYRDFLLMNDRNSKYYEPNPDERQRIKANYRNRHKGDNLENPFSAGALSYYLLWNRPTLRASIKDYESKFNIKIKV
tara:strand:- start:1911 stop:2228 length:318 start_codon:yes stop_codon:yes gene_type:complete